MNEDVMTIREMCAAFDVTPRTLRFYEAKELLFPIRKGQARLFTRADRGRLKLILRGKRYGFSLEDMRQLLNLYSIGDGQVTQLDRTLTLARKRLAELVAAREEITKTISALTDEIGMVTDMLDRRRQAHAA